MSKYNLKEFLENKLKKYQSTFKNTSYDDTNNFIKFKYQKASYIESKEIKSKFEKGTNILKDMLEKFTPKDNVFIFCVVFENQKRSKYFDSRHIETNSIKFGLDELNKNLGGFYDNIITQDIDFYKNNFKKLICK